MVDEEQALLARVRAGDSAAFGELYRRYLPDARAMAARLSGRIDPGDVANEAFMRVLVALRRGGGPVRGFRPYLMMAVRRQVIDQAQRVKPTVPLTEEHGRWTGEAPDAAGDEIIDVEYSVRCAMAELPERWREVLWEVDVIGRPVRDVAIELGLTPNALSAMIYRARSRLREVLAATAKTAGAVAMSAHDGARAALAPAPDHLAGAADRVDRGADVVGRSDEPAMADPEQTELPASPGRAAEPDDVGRSGRQRRPAPSLRRPAGRGSVVGSRAQARIRRARSCARTDGPGCRAGPAVTARGRARRLRYRRARRPPAATGGSPEPVPPGRLGGIPHRAPTSPSSGPAGPASFAGWCRATALATV